MLPFDLNLMLFIIHGIRSNINSKQMSCMIWFKFVSFSFFCMIKLYRQGQQERREGKGILE